MAALHPTIRSVVMCDCIHQDRTTGKWSMLGAFSRVQVKKLPATYSPIALYICMGDWIESGKFSIKVTFESTHLIASMPEIEIPAITNPGAAVQLGVNLPPLTLNAAGRYAIEIFVNKDLVHEFIFHVIVAAPMSSKEKKHG